MEELSKNWRIVLACFFGIMLSSSSIPFYTLGAFTVPLQAEYGWSRAQVQGAMAFLTLGSLITVPLVGMAIDRFGTRAVGLVSIILLGLTLMNIGLTTSSLSIFYLNWILMSGFAAGTTPITWTRALNGWFDKQRGIALGFALAGTGVAGITTPQLATFMIEQYGWRLAYVGLGLLPIIISLPMVFFLLRDPPKLSKTSNAVEKSIALANQLGLTLAEAIRGWRFWVIATAFFGISIGIGGTISNLIPLLHDNGMDLATAASVAGTIGMSVIVGRVIAGFLIDRYWAPLVAFFVFCMPAVSCWLLAGEVQSIPLAVTAAALIGLAAGAEFDMISYLTSRYFGLKHYGKIYAWQFAAFSIGAGFSPPVFGRVFDLYGSYGPILLVSGLLYVGGAVLLLTLGRYPQFAVAK
jgi:MFS family permease